MKSTVLWVLLLVGVCLTGSLWSTAPVAMAQDEITVAKAQKEARLLKFQVDRLRNLLTILKTNVNQISSLAVRIRSILGEVNGPAAAPRSQRRVRIALQHVLAAFDTISCVLPQPSVELECRFKDSEGENIGLLDLIRAAMSDPELSISARIESLREMIDELKDNELISAGAASKIKSQLNKIENDLGRIEESISSIETILSDDPEEGIQQFLEIIRTDLDQDGEVTWEEIKDARENASRAVGVARDPETKEPTFLRKALIEARSFGALIRQLLSDFTSIPSQLHTAESIGLSREELFGATASRRVESVFDLSGRLIYQVNQTTEEIASIKDLALTKGRNQKSLGAFLALVVTWIEDKSSQRIERRVQKLILKI
jgi:hypothetical protein